MAGLLTDCPGAKSGPTLVAVLGGYCIDSTEVTRSQYGLFLASNPSMSAQDPWCAWNTALAPDPKCMADSHVCKENCSQHPQVCVDWCDAFAYCRAVGKRLCGKPGGGAAAFNSHSTASGNQWFNACSSGGMSAYVYGSAYETQTCNGFDNKKTGCLAAYGDCTTTAVGGLSGCQSAAVGYAGVYDLSGNVSEWEDSCAGQTGASDPCRVRGGSFLEVGLCALESFSPGISRARVSKSVGFRCCAP
jgi:formylglycine-generating enzyme required for sulfatase activity